MCVIREVVALWVEVAAGRASVLFWNMLVQQDAEGRCLGVESQGGLGEGDVGSILGRVLKSSTSARVVEVAWRPGVSFSSKLPLHP